MVQPRQSAATHTATRSTPSCPRVGFLGVGWIGRHRLQAAVESELLDVVALCDPSPEAVAAAREVVPAAAVAGDLDEMLARDLDGLVIATPSALHATQALAALRRGVAVFCQKPLARTAAETSQILREARRQNLPLGVDLSYRHLRGVAKMRQLIQGSELGRVFAVDLVFHNAYGPDKAWFYDFERSGGGCLIDLGTHLIDLAQWMLGAPAITELSSCRMAKGEPVVAGHPQVEDYASVHWLTDQQTHVRLTCSWHLPAGCDAVIEATFYGTQGAVSLKNVDGSFYDFVVQHLRGTQTETLAQPPDAWGGRAIVQWARALCEGRGYDPETEALLQVAQIIDRSYER